tara:strand:+ start:11826 stop:12188 length:363 start_codon:yes stop_codon:yes gene_type:complete
MCYHLDVPKGASWQQEAKSASQALTLCLVNPRQHVKDHLKTLSMQQHLGIMQRRSTVVKEDRVKTTPKLVEESNTGLFHARMNLPEAAKHCGMTQKEMKMTFWEYLKYNPPVEPINKQEH